MYRDVGVRLGPPRPGRQRSLARMRARVGNWRYLTASVLALASVVFWLLAIPAATTNAQPASAQTCPCTIWPASAMPTSTVSPDTGSIEVGVKFRSDTAGYVTGVRFYKLSTNTGTHVGNLWSSNGTNLA